MIEYSKRGKKRSMKLSGDLLIEQSAELLKAFKSCLKADSIHVDTNSLLSIDLPNMQIICSALKTFKGLNKVFTLDFEKGGYLDESFRKSGININL